MNFRIVSDLHLEFGALTLPILRDESKSVLVIAGDLGLTCKPNTYLPFLYEVSRRFKQVLWVFGNHEYYKDAFLRARHHAEEAIQSQRLENVRILENESVDFGETIVLGCTMWTTMRDNNPIVCETVRNRMTDYRVIRFGPSHEPYQRPILPTDISKVCQESKTWLNDALQAAREANKKILVVTHHAPSRMSIANDYRDNELNDAYVESMGDMMARYRPEVWVHGHVHRSFDYQHPTGTRILCNPRGYFMHEENSKFDPNLQLVL